MRAIQLATWKAAMEYAAGLCEAEKVEARDAAPAEDIAYNWATDHCAAAIRQAPEPATP